MTDHLSRLSSRLREEAGILLHDKGLLSLLQEYGPVIAFGSYVYDLMTCRDLDLCIETEDFSGEILSLGGRLASLLQPYEMFHVNSIRFKADLGGRGVYWGLRTDNTPESWWLDIWAYPPGNCRYTEGRIAEMRQRLNETNRQQIMDIKAACCGSPDYRRQCWARAHPGETFCANDIYTAVFDHGVTSPDEFLEYRRRQAPETKGVQK